MDIEECFQSVSDGKSLVAAAITDKGVETAADATFTVMSQNIGNLSSALINVGTTSYTVPAGVRFAAASGFIAGVVTSTSQQNISVNITKNGVSQKSASASAYNSGGATVPSAACGCHIVMPVVKGDVIRCTITTPSNDFVTKANLAYIDAC